MFALNKVYVVGIGPGAADQMTVKALRTLEISGISSGNGSYAGNVGFSPVPEAATWAMMIAGVGIAGIALRRRRRADGAADPRVSYAF